MWRIQKNSIHQNILIGLDDKTTGLGATGIAHTDITCRAMRQDYTAAQTVTLAAGTAIGTWGSGHFKEVNATTMKGVYQVGIPDALLAEGSDWLALSFMDETHCLPCRRIIELTDLRPDGPPAHDHRGTPT